MDRCLNDAEYRANAQAEQSGVNMDQLVKDRFWSKVDKTGDCWEWTAGKFNNGYGSFCMNGSDIGAHRASIMLSGIDIPAGMQVLHHCDNPGCVRQSHLFIGTAADNIKDMIAKDRHARGRMFKDTKLNIDKVREILQLKGTMPYRKIADHFGVCHSTISHIMNGRNWAHVKVIENNHLGFVSNG